MDKTGEGIFSCYYYLLLLFNFGYLSAYRHVDMQGRSCNGQVIFFFLWNL